MSRKTPFSSCAGCFALLVLLALVHPPVARAGDLDDDQAKRLQSARSSVSSARANLKLAEDSAGPADATPSRSRAKLALVRAGSAKSDIQRAEKALEGLPAEHAQVAAVCAEAGEVAAAIAALEARLTGGSPAAGGGAEAGGTKLDYRQEKKLKDGQYYVREIEGIGESLHKLDTQIAAVEEKDTIDHRQIATAMASVEKARQRAGLVVGYLKELPPEGTGVSALAQALDAAVARIDAAEKAIGPLHERLQRLVDPATYPELEADVKRLQELGRMYRNPGLLLNDPERAIEAVQNAPAAHAEMVRIVQAYAGLIRQQTDLGKRVGGVAKFFLESHETFGQAVNAQKQQLPGVIAAGLQEAEKLAAEAVAQKNAGFFHGGIPHFLGQAERRLGVLEALDPQGAAPLKAKLAETRALMKERQASLREEIIASNPLPPDRYAGADKDALREKAIAAWKEQQADAEILGVRFPSETWSRETMWRLHDRTWYRIDRSKLQAQLLVRHDDDLAVIQPVNLWIDHMKGDRMSVLPVDVRGDELPPQRFLRIDKIR